MGVFERTPTAETSVLVSVSVEAAVRHVSGSVFYICTFSLKVFPSPIKAVGLSDI